MYKVTFYVFEAKLRMHATDLSPEVEKYINDYSQQGYKLVSMTSMDPVGLMFVWEKK